MFHRPLISHARPRCPSSLFASVPLALIAATLPMAFAPATSLAQTTPPASPRLTMDQTNIVRKFEKKLKTPLNSKDNPGDKYTWYVFGFTETAVGARQSRAVSGNTLTVTRELQAARNRAARVIQGREAAAVLLLEYYSVGNSAFAELCSTAGGRTDRATAAADKAWCYRAFATEGEAKEFFDRINPKPKKRK